MNKSSNRHMNIFHSYTQNESRPIENNISRGFAILLQEHPALLVLLLDKIQKDSSALGNLRLPIPESEYLVDFQVETGKFEGPITYLIGVTVTAAELEDDILTDGNIRKRKQITDISIRYDDVLIVIEVKRTSVNCDRQVQAQMKCIQEALKESMPDQIINPKKPVRLTWKDIYILLQQYCRLTDRNAGRLVNDYMDYLASNFPSWVPVQPLSKLTTNQIEQIEARLDMIKNEYAKDHLPAMYGLVGGRRAIPINEDFVKECNLAFEPSFIMPDGNQAECVTLGMWPADTGGQYWQFKKIKPQKSRFFKNRYTTIAADETTINVSVLPYVKFSHFMGKGIQWLSMKADSVSNRFNDWMTFSDTITGRVNKGTPAWDALMPAIRAHAEFFDKEDLDAFEAEFHQNFANKAYVFVSCGMEIKAFIPYRQAQILDSQDGAFANMVKSVIAQLLKEMRSGK